MTWYEKIYFIVWDLGLWFGNAYEATSEWWWPFNLISEPLYWIYHYFISIRNDVGAFVTRMRDLYDLVDELGIWGAIWLYIRNALPWLDAAAEFFEDLIEEVKLFFQDPVGRLEYYGKYYVLPWMQDNIPFVATIYEWFINFAEELELFFIDPVERLKYWGLNYVLPWFEENVPFIATIYHWFIDFAYQLELFFQDPEKYILETLDLDQKLIDWLKDVFPFYDTLVEIWESVVEFFTSPLDFLVDLFADWFLGEEE